VLGHGAQAVEHRFERRLVRRHDRHAQRLLDPLARVERPEVRA
jgi:hypothetical protein